MRKPGRALLGLLLVSLAAGPAGALEPGDLVVGVGASLFVVDPESGAAEPLSLSPALGAVTSVAARADGTVFFALTDPLVGSAAVWRLDARSGERTLFAPPVPGPGISIGGVALDPQGRLVVAYANGAWTPGTWRPLTPIGPASTGPEVQWLDAESGELLARVPLPGNVLGISDVAADPQGRAFVTTARSGILRVDPGNGALEWVGAAWPRSSFSGATLALEADGSILYTSRCIFAETLPGRPVGCLSGLRRVDPETAMAETLASFDGLAAGVAVEADGGIVVSLIPGLQQFGPGRVLRIDPEDGSASVLVDDLPSVMGIAVVPYPEPRIELRPSRIRLGPRGAHGMLHVRLFGSEHLDVRDVETGSLRFGPGAAAPRSVRVVQRGRKRPPELRAAFRAAEAGFRPGDTRACLGGWTDARFFQACADIRVAGSRTTAALAAGELVVATGASLEVVDPVSGATRLLSPGSSFGPLPQGVITGIAVRPGGGELFYVLRGFVGSAGSLWRVDPASGVRELVAGPGLVGFSQPAGVVLEPGGSLLVVDGDELLRFDPTSGEASLVALLAGIPLGRAPSGLALDEAGNAWIATRSLPGGLSQLLRVDLASGAQSVVADALPELSGVAVDADGSLLVTARAALPTLFAPGPEPVLPGPSVIRIDPESGAAILVAEQGLLRVPDGLVREARGTLAVIDGGGAAGDAVLRVDPRNGEQSLLAPLPALSDASAIAVVPPAPRGHGWVRRPPPF